jgi:multiple sugar transport system ATP-binding protein
VYALEPLGDRSLVDVRLGEAVLKIRTRPTASFRINEPLRAGIDLDRVHLFDAETGEAVPDTGDTRA